MKRSLSFLAVLATIFLLSCSEDEPAANGGRQFGGAVTFTANEWTDTFDRNTIAVYSGTFELSVYLNEHTKSFSLTIPAGIAETSYDVKQNVVSAVYYMYDTKGHYSYWGETPHGQVVITEIDEVNKTMSGTFSALLERQTGEMDITNGTFTDVPYMIQEEPKGTEVIAKLDDADFKGKISSYGIGSNLMFALTNDKQILDFALPADLLEVGTFDVADFSQDIYTGVRYIDGLYSYRATTGTITITEYTANHHIKGTFQFDVSSYPIAGTTKSFTAGTFDVSFDD